MKIDLNEKIQQHLQRLENLAKEAEIDEGSSYSNRAAAMTALSNLLKELTKTQEDIINMERLMRIEKVVIETVKEFVKPKDHDVFLSRLEQTLNAQ